MCSANFGNVWRRAVIKFNQMSNEKLEMSGEAQKISRYTGPVVKSVIFVLQDRATKMDKIMIML